jgi:ferredoxin
MVVSADKNKCLRCGGCVGVCPFAALYLSEHGIDCNEKCTNCTICVQFCPVGALKLKK